MNILILMLRPQTHLLFRLSLSPSHLSQQLPLLPSPFQDTSQDYLWMFFARILQQILHRLPFIRPSRPNLKRQQSRVRSGLTADYSGNHGSFSPFASPLMRSVHSKQARRERKPLNNGKEKLSSSSFKLRSLNASPGLTMMCMTS